MMRFVWAISVGLAGASSAIAAPITYDFAGTVTAKQDPEAGPGVLPLQVGDKIAITLTVDGAISDGDASPNIGSYDNLRDLSLEPPLVLSLDIGGTGGNAMFQKMIVQNDVNGIDSIYIETWQVLIGIQAELLFSTTDLSVLTSDTIPTSIDPADFETATFVRRIFLDRDFAAGTIDSGIVDVPEPAAGALLLGGILMLAGLRRRDARRSWL